MCSSLHKIWVSTIFSDSHGFRLFSRFSDKIRLFRKNFLANVIFSSFSLHELCFSRFLSIFVDFHVFLIKTVFLPAKIRGSLIYSIIRDNKCDFLAKFRLSSISSIFIYLNPNFYILLQFRPQIHYFLNFS